MTDESMRNINPFGLRMQPALREKVEEAAKANRRSLNAEISARLEESFVPRTMDDIEAARPRELDRELAELSVESYRLTCELNLLQKQVKKAVSDEDRYRLMDESDEVSAKIGQVEAKRHQKLQQLAALQGQR